MPVSLSVWRLMSSSSMTEEHPTAAAVPPGQIRSARIIAKQWRADPDRERSHLHRRNRRCSLPGIRLQDRKIAVDLQARLFRYRYADHLFGKERQAVCGGGGDRRDGGLRSAWWRFPGGVCVIQRK